jgi:hypothetical protein
LGLGLCATIINYRGLCNSIRKKLALICCGRGGGAASNHIQFNSIHIINIINIAST